MILGDLVTLLVADGDVNALISGNIYTGLAPDGADPPYITQVLLLEQRLIVLEGGLATPSPARVQLDCWSDGLEEAIDLADKVETAMFGASTFSIGDFSRESDYEADTKLHRIIIDCSLWQ